MWLLSWLPDSFLHMVILATIAVGAIAYGIGLLLNFFPPFYVYKEPSRILGSLLMIIGVYFYGSYSTEMEWREKVKQVEAKLKEAEAQSAQVNTVIQTKIVVQKQIVHDKQVEIQKEIQLVEKRIDAECKVDPVIPKILNEAAMDPLNPQKLNDAAAIYMKSQAGNEK